MQRIPDLVHQDSILVKSEYPFFLVYEEGTGLLVY